MVFDGDRLSWMPPPEHWLYMAWMDVRVRYRRTVLGPFWSVFASLIPIVMISVLASVLFKLPLRAYFPYVASGMSLWGFFAAVMTVGCKVFTERADLMKHVRVDPLSYVLRAVVGELINFGHGFAVLLVLLAVCRVSFAHVCWFVPALLLTSLAACAFTMILGLVCTRYRDIQQLMQSLIGLFGMLTPIMWKAEMLGAYQHWVMLNPFYHFLVILRHPLLGMLAPSVHWLAALAWTAGLSLVAAWAFIRYRHDLIHWL